MTEFTPRGNERDPDPRQSGAAYETTRSGDAASSDETVKRQGQWLPPAAGGSASATDPGPGARRRIGKKSAWIIGGVIAVAAASVALSAAARLSLSGGTSSVNVAAASSAPPRAAAAPDAGNSAPLVSKSAKAQRVPSVSARPTLTRSGPPASPGTTVSSPPSSAAAAPPAAPATTNATAPTTVSVPEPVSWWPLDDRTGTTAADSMGAHPGTASNINWCIPQYGSCAAFNGTDSDIVTSGPVLDTAPGSSFTVSAVVDMTATAGFETIVSQDGTDDSGFYLQYLGTSNLWAFARVVSDTDQGPAGIRALSTSVASLNTWTRLVGVFDASDDQLRLYVNGALEGTATDTTPFAATGPLAIGRGQFDGQPTNWFTGAAGEIQVWNVALTSAQVAKIPN
jgi:hypothetical protein